MPAKIRSVEPALAQPDNLAALRERQRLRHTV